MITPVTRPAIRLLVAAHTVAAAAIVVGWERASRTGDIDTQLTVAAATTAAVALQLLTVMGVFVMARQRTVNALRTVLAPHMPDPRSPAATVTRPDGTAGPVPSLVITSGTYRHRPACPLVTGQPTRRARPGIPLCPVCRR